MKQWQTSIKLYGNTDIIMQVQGIHLLGLLSCIF